MRGYTCQYNDCRLCLYGRKPTLTEYFIKKWTQDWCAAVCTAPDADLPGHSPYPIDHGENEHLPCRLYKER